MIGFSTDDSSSDGSDDEVAPGPAWMNKFAPLHSNQNYSVVPVPSNAEFPINERTEPSRVQKFGGHERNNFDLSMTSTSSSARSFGKEDTPEWMQNLIDSRNLCGSMHGPKPGRQFSSSSDLPSTTPSTPTWMKQYRKEGEIVAGAPIIQSFPTLNSSNHSRTPAWKKSALNSSINSLASDTHTQIAVPETTNWRKGHKQTPKLQYDHNDDDDSKSVSSLASIQSSTSVRSRTDPEWMIKFSKIKAGRCTSISQPEEPVLSTSPAAEPERMKRFHEIGMTEATSTPKASSTTMNTGVPPRPAQSLHHIATINMKATHSHSTPSRGVSSTPSSPKHTSALTVAPTGIAGEKTTMMSAPSSPVSQVGQLRSPLNLLSGSQRLYEPTQRRRQSLGGPWVGPDPPTCEQVVIPPRIGDPAANEIEKLEWMDKAKAIAKTQDEKPVWMQKLLQKKQGKDLPEEKNRSKQTPPWKIRERLKEEQLQKLRESLGLDMGVEEGGEDDDEIDEGSWDSGDDSSDEEESVPEWMKQFKKMDLKAARVLTAQGRAPQTVASLRTGSATMTARTGEIIDDSQVIKAISVRSHSSRSLKMSRHASFRSCKTQKEKSKRSVHASSTDDASESSFADQEAQSVYSRDKNHNKVDQTVSVSTILKPNEHKTPTWRSPFDVSAHQEKKTLDYGSLHSANTTTISDQVEIIKSAPENVMGMWGETVKAKKPDNATLMSWRKIQNQAEKVKERIERAKKGGNIEGTESQVAGQKSGVGPSYFDESATALFFGDGEGKKFDAFSMDNSRAVIADFGTGQAGGGNSSQPRSMDDSEESTMKLGVTSEEEKNQKDLISNDAGTGSQRVAEEDKRKLLSSFFNETSTELLPNDLAPGVKASEADLLEGRRPAFSSFEPQSFVTTAAVIAQEDKSPLSLTKMNKKPFLDESDCDGSDSENDSIRQETKPTQKTSALVTDPGKDTFGIQSRNTTATSGSIAPPQRKQSCLDNSVSEDDSSSDESVRKRPPTKGRIYGKHKTESTMPLIPNRVDRDEQPTKNNVDDSGISTEEPTNTIQSTRVVDAWSDFRDDNEENPHPSSDLEHAIKLCPLKETDEVIVSNSSETASNRQSSLPFPSDRQKKSKATPSSMTEVEIEDQVKEDEGQDAPVDLGTEEKEKQTERDEWEAALIGLKTAATSALPVIESGSKDKYQSFSKKTEKIDSNAKRDKEIDSSNKNRKKDTKRDDAVAKERKSPKKEIVTRKEAKIDQSKLNCLPKEKPDESEKSVEKRGRDTSKELKREKKDEKKSKEKSSKDRKSTKTPKHDSSSSKQDHLSKRKTRSESRDLNVKRSRSVEKPRSSSNVEKKINSVSKRSHSVDKRRSASEDKSSSKAPSKDLESLKTHKSKESDSKKLKSPMDKSSSKLKSREKLSSKMGKPPIPLSKSKKVQSPLKPKKMPALVIQPKSSKNITRSKPKSSANLVIKPKSKISLIPTRPKSRTSLIPSSKPKSKTIPATDFDDNDSFVMNDFDDDFSIPDDFGDFAEDGSVIPLKAVRNPPSVKRDGKKSSKTDSKSKKKSKDSTKGSAAGVSNSKGKKSDKKKAVDKKHPKKKT